MADPDGVKGHGAGVVEATNAPRCHVNAIAGKETEPINGGGVTIGGQAHGALIVEGGAQVALDDGALGEERPSVVELGVLKEEGVEASVRIGSRAGGKEIRG